MHFFFLTAPLRQLLPQPQRLRKLDFNAYLRMYEVVRKYIRSVIV